MCKDWGTMCKQRKQSTMCKHMAWNHAPLLCVTEHLLSL
jgi:hypothetical protein